MAYEIVPKSGVYVSATEVAQRLTSEFLHVVVDEAAGNAAALLKAALLENANPAILLGWHEEALNNARNLRRLAPGEALVIRFGDNGQSLVSVTVLPNEPLKFGYGSSEEEQAMRATVERCAKALNANVVVI